MHDIIGPILEAVADAATTGGPVGPRWMRRGCAVISGLFVVAILALIFWPR